MTENGKTIEEYFFYRNKTNDSFCLHKDKLKVTNELRTYTLYRVNTSLSLVEVEEFDT